MTEVNAARLAAAEQQLAEQSPGYLDRVRRAAAGLGVADPEADDARAALDAVDHFAVVDLDVPTGSRFPLAHLLKLLIKKLISWYLGYIGRQLTTFGQAVTNLADILVDQTESLSRANAALRSDVTELAERVERLEKAKRSKG
jgi:hypothetical protein